MNDPITVTAAAPQASPWMKVAEIGGNVASAAAGFISAERQMKFQERMSNTAIQRQVADAKKAGVNPMYLFGSSGAEVPSGAMINPDSPTRGLTQNYLQERLNTPQRQLVRRQADAAGMAASASKAQAEQAHTQALLNVKGLDKMQADIDAIRTNIPYTSAQTAREVIENYKRRATRSIYKLPYVGPALGAIKELLGR